VNRHKGNKRYRALVESMKTAYLSPTTRKLEKAHIAASVVNSIRRLDPPGRFLKEDPKCSGIWHEIGDKAAIRKVRNMRQLLNRYVGIYSLTWNPFLLHAPWFFNLPHCRGMFGVDWAGAPGELVRVSYLIDRWCSHYTNGIYKGLMYVAINYIVLLITISSNSVASAPTYSHPHPSLLCIAP